MSPCSPYAQFRADAWMRTSSIQPKKQTTHLRTTGSTPQEGDMTDERKHIQGQLFLFPIVLAS